MESEGLPEAACGGAGEHVDERGPSSGSSGCDRRRGMGGGGAGDGRRLGPGGKWSAGPSTPWPGDERPPGTVDPGDLRSRFAAVSDDASYILGSPERVAAQQLVWRGSLERGTGGALEPVPVTRGRPGRAGLVRSGRGSICVSSSFAVGAWEEAARLLDEWAEPSERDVLAWGKPMYERCRALLAAGRGLVDEAYRWAAESISRAEGRAGGSGLGPGLEALRALGTAALLGHNPRRAAESLGGVWAHTERVGVEEPRASSRWRRSSSRRWSSSLSSRSARAGTHDFGSWPSSRSTRGGSRGSSAAMG